MTTNQLDQPARAEITLGPVLQALADPVRMQIIRTLAADGGERACGTFGLPVTKSTTSHHFRVLREAGVVATRHDGRRRLVTLRRADLDARLPGLLDSVLAGAA